MHDPSQPSTNTCPYLPGQTVNTLWIPVEQSLRKRSASLTSLREDDFKTMNPASKFVSPRPAPTPPELTRRLGTAPLRAQPHKRSARSLSPGSAWKFSPRKLFSRKSSSSSLRDAQTLPAEDERVARSEGSRSRDISPESLRRFLVDDVARHDQDSETSDRPGLYIPEDIVEENEDDDNFASSAVSETMQFTGLSPPPQRGLSPSPPTTAVPSHADAQPSSPLRIFIPAAPTRPPPTAPLLLSAAPAPCPPQIEFQSRFSIDSPDSASPPAFYYSEDDDEDDEAEEEVDGCYLPLQGTTTITAPAESTVNANPNSFARNINASLSTYSLPRTAVADAEAKQHREQAQRQPGGGAASLLSSPIPDSGLGDLVSELSWMADLIRGEYV